MKKGWIILSVLAMLISFYCVPGVFAGVPQMINYQGTLTNSGGTPVANGNYSIEFKMYDVASGGTALWTEKWDTTTSQVTVVGGNFNAMLGFLTPIPTNFFADHPVTFLGIKVGTDSEMLPRQQITSVGYAFTAGNGVPKGGIIMWSGAIADIPADWALCDGVERTRTDGTKVTPPNLKDRFVIGAGNGYAVGATGGESAHTLTIAEMPSHTHVQDAHTHIQNPHRHTQAKKGVEAGSGEDVADNSTTDEWTTASTTATNQNTTATNQNAGSGSAHNNLPPYYALAFIMKL
jgi:microcystin-dependent protein